MIHDPIRPSIEQLFAQWKTERFFRNANQVLHDTSPVDEIAERERLWGEFERRNDRCNRLCAEVLARLDATFGPGMGEAVKEMIGNG